MFLFAALPTASSMVLSAALLFVLFAAFFAPRALGAENSGATIFKSKCVLCHGADGTGNTPLGKQLQAANLRTKDVQKKSDAELTKVVHDGNGNMPPFGEQLSDDEISQVIQYVRTFGKTAKK
jgi:cytochrome c6